MYYAHSANRNNDWHQLKRHLSQTACLAESFASNSFLKSEAQLAGFLHDVGKYGDLFQARLHGKVSHVDHWSAGAWMALLEYRSIAAALSIQGHHIGLQQLDKQSLKRMDPQRLKEMHPLGFRVSESNANVLSDRFYAECERLPLLEQTVLANDITSSVSRMLDVRMLFSCLVDADFIDTEAHFESTAEGKKHRPLGLSLRATDALKLLQEYIQRLETQKAGKTPTKVIEIRRKLLDACLDAAQGETGLFSLTAPTGSGKTLGMLAFALQHAANWALDRVIVVIPYLSIIQQTVEVYQAIFREHYGSEYILEHHSLAGCGEEPAAADDDGDSAPEISPIRRLQLLSENWDAPVIVTTSVQFLESLFSNRPSACRKLHRLMRSVVLFDEVQTLPANLAVPMLAGLSHLAHQYGSTVVFATATQPAFDHLHASVAKQCSRGWQPRPIVPNPHVLFGALERTTVRWEDPRTPFSWRRLAERLMAYPQVLCIVNVKRHARELIEAMGDADTFHLSTNLCPAHREQVLGMVKERLRGGQPVRLVATQCVEAGVDLDFPVVWRAYAPLDAIIQAAGRCNRDGRMNRAGDVYVFMPEDEAYPVGYYEQAAQITKILLRGLKKKTQDIQDPDFVQSYYRMLYDMARPDVSERAQEILNAVKAGDFPRVARGFRLIPRDSMNVVVPYAGAREEYRLLDADASEGLNRYWIRRARRLAINLFRPQPDDPIWCNMRPVPLTRRAADSLSEWYIYLNPEDYDERLGLVTQSRTHLWMI